jgi:serine/threonine protein kinase
MRPVKEHRLRREVKILQHVSGGPNIVRLLDIVRDPETRTPSFVFDYVEAMPFKELQASVSDLDVRYYTLQLLVALEFCHSQGIMHRDVKVRQRHGQQTGSVRASHRPHERLAGQLSDGPCTVRPSHAASSICVVTPG